MEETKTVSSVTEKPDAEITEDSLRTLLEDADLSVDDLIEGSGQLADEEETEEEDAEVESEEESEDDSEPEEEDEESEDETEEEADEETEEEDPESDEEPVGSKRVQKRIDKLTKNWREAQDKVRELEAQLEDERSQRELVSAPSEKPSEFDHLKTLEDVQRAYDEAAGVIEWAEDNEDGAIVTKKDGTEVEYSAEEVKQIRRAAQRARERGLPQRFQYLQAVGKMDALAKEKYPDLIKADSALSREVERVLKAVPALAGRADHKLMIADWVRGRQAREAEEKAKQEPQKKKKLLKKPKKVPIKRSSAPQTAKPKARLRAVDEEGLASLLLDTELL